MNDLVRKYGDQLVCLGFPCNQFGHQEGGNNTEILNCLKHVRPGNGFVPNFDLSVKVQVNGSDEDPLFTFLKASLPMPYDDEDATRMGANVGPRNEFLCDSAEKILWKPVKRSDISWNFEKFLVAPDGTPFRRYSRFHSTIEIATDIEELLKQIE